MIKIISNLMRVKTNNEIPPNLIGFRQINSKTQAGTYTFDHISDGRATFILLITRNGYNGSIYGVTKIDDNWNIQKLSGETISSFTHTASSISFILTNWSQACIIGLGIEDY